jgi:signal transduction histidine kinase
MSAFLDDNAFNSLYPFAFLTDAAGTMLQVGNALQKLGCVSPGTVAFIESFSIVAPSDRQRAIMPDSLVGELVVLESRANTGVKLRGHVVQVDKLTRCYLFALHLAVTEVDKVRSLGLELSDFEVGTPIFDFLMLLRTYQVGQEKLREVNAQLSHDVKLSRLLQRITSEAYRLEDTRALYQSALSVVCVELGWDIGHVFLSDGAECPTMVSTDIWFLSEPERYAPFVECSEHLSWEGSLEFPMLSPSRRTPVWVTNFNHNGDFIRAKMLRSKNEATAVAVPVWVGDRLYALLEFISDTPQSFSDTYYGFFSLLGSQIGFAVGHHEAARKEREQLAAVTYASKMATLGEIAAGVAHEINNPVSTISLITQVLKRVIETGALTPELLTEQLQRIGLCVNSVVKIVSELRDFSRESSQDPFEATAIEKVIRDTIGLCHARFLAHGVSLQLPSEPITATIDCRPSQISQVILNLLNNAHDAALKSDERWVRMECREHSNRVELSVIDSGLGVPNDIRERIMQPFFTTKPPGQGTGLGLSISSNIAIDHGGMLFFEPNAPHTCFTLSLPKSRVAGDKTPK